MRKVFIGAVLMVTLCSVIAFAADDKLYPGVMGVRYNASQPVPHESYGALYNPSSTSTLSLALPIVRDGSGGNIDSGWVKLVDQHYNQDISVRLYSIYRSDSTGEIYGWLSSTQTTTGSGPQVQTLTFGSLATNTYSSAYYFVTLPPTYSGVESQVISYYVVEQ